MACISKEFREIDENDEETSSFAYLTSSYVDKENISTEVETKKSKKRIPEEVRLRVNDRERHRMHQMNNAMESLKHVLPYSRSVGKMSKLSTLQLARNYIVSLQKTQNELLQLKERLMAEQSKTRVQKTPVNVHVLQSRGYSVQQDPGFSVYMDKHLEIASNIDLHSKPRGPLCDITNTNSVPTVKIVPATTRVSVVRKTLGYNFIPSDISNTRTKSNATASLDITSTGYMQNNMVEPERQKAAKSLHKFSIERLLS